MTEDVVYRFAVIYRDGWGDYAADKFGTRAEAQQRADWLAERGRVATVQSVSA